MGQDDAGAVARFCPVCGQDASEAFCALDGTATVVRRKVAPEDLEVGVGRVVGGRYRITGRIGRGGFGAVFSAVHTGTGQDVALKLLHIDLSADNTSIVRRFWQEAQITARLRHANTVRVFDVGQSEEGAFFLAMERLHGDTLAGRLEAHAAAGMTMAVEDALQIAIGVCGSLQEAHRLGLVHRDLKPANIMLVDHPDGGDEEVKVLDFGIARRADSSLTSQGAALGTPAYMSPEQCRGQRLDGRSDLYALGAILFRCVAGRTPFFDENPLTVMFQHATLPPPDLRRLCPTPPSEAFVAIVERALAKQPEDRFEDAAAMRDALERALRSGAADATLLLGSAAVPAPNPSAGDGRDGGEARDAVHTHTNHAAVASVGAGARHPDAASPTALLPGAAGAPAPQRTSTPNSTGTIAPLDPGTTSERDTPDLKRLPDVDSRRGVAWRIVVGLAVAGAAAAWWASGSFSEAPAPGVRVHAARPAPSATSDADAAAAATTDPAAATTDPAAAATDPAAADPTAAAAADPVATDPTAAAPPDALRAEANTAAPASRADPDGASATEPAPRRLRKKPARRDPAADLATSEAPKTPTSRPNASPTSRPEPTPTVPTHDKPTPTKPTPRPTPTTQPAPTAAAPSTTPRPEPPPAPAPSPIPKRPIALD